MGVIAKQSVKGTIFIYSGAILGFLINAFFFPHLLKTEEIGLIGILLSYSVIFAQIGSLGLGNITTKLFPYFRSNTNMHNGFLFLAIMITILGFAISMLGFYLIKPFLVAQNLEKSILLGNYINYVVPLTFFVMVYNTLDRYNSVLYDILAGIFLKECFQRLMIVFLLILLFLKLINFHRFIFFYVVVLSMPAALMLLKLIKQKQITLRPQLQYITKPLWKSIWGVGIFGIISSATGVISLNIDRVMIAKILDLSSVGIYTTTFFFGTMVVLPSRALTRISSVIVADSWKNNDLKMINKIYYKSSLNLFIIGLLVLLGIWVNIQNVFKILPIQYAEGKFVILFIALSYIFDMVSGVSNSIILNSKYYRVQTYLMIILVLMSIIFNYFLIPIYGIIGAAMATAISKLVYSLIKFFFILVKFKMQPYNFKFLITLTIAIASYFISRLIPVIEPYIWDILIRSISVVIIYGLLILFLNVSEDIIDKAKYLIRIWQPRG